MAPDEQHVGSEQGETVNLAILTKADRQPGEGYGNLVLVRLDDLLQRIVDQEPGLDLVRSTGHRAHPAVLGPEGLTQPVGDLAPVLDHLAGQHSGSHPVKVRSRVDGEQDRLVLGAVGPVAVQLGEIHGRPPLVAVDRPPTPSRAEHRSDPTLKERWPTNPDTEQSADQQQRTGDHQQRPYQLRCRPRQRDGGQGDHSHRRAGDDQQQPHQQLQQPPRDQQQQREPQGLPPHSQRRSWHPATNK
jgi:hypothetical protein